ncbi:hypothetical protein EI42_03147 [Thermosporothrix hazakensis]|jgi:predicted DNA-binding protein YlxM (UPF0122 family)|uniref:Uncharacterized protein n=1 Tax=Thermosporothrix hazakensis TaxID=644383 RepID=A0A326U556_THEHA|nr:hypothetical protein EI42_03147 [Thermosporothrix hazakensis]GCE45173.1 hypothetical protein KTH_00420 [Thermosporothrix hazakensis]
MRGREYISVLALTKELGAPEKVLFNYTFERHRFPPSTRVYVTVEDAEKLRQWYSAKPGQVASESGFISVQEAARKLGIHTETVKARARRLKIPTSRFFKDSNLYIHKDALEKLALRPRFNRARAFPYVKDEAGVLYIAIPEICRQMSVTRQCVNDAVRRREYTVYRGSRGINSIIGYILKRDFCDLVSKKSIDPETLPWDTAKLDEMSPREK